MRQQQRGGNARKKNKSAASKVDVGVVQMPCKYDLTVTVVDFEGGKVEGATVFVKTSNGKGLVAKGTTTAEGVAVVKVTKGTYVVEAEKEGLERLPSESWEGTVSVDDDSAKATRTIGDCIVTVTVKDLHGVVVPGADVEVTHAESGKVQHTAKTGEDGVVAIYVWAGKYKVKASKVSYCAPRPELDRSEEVVVVADHRATAARVLAGLAKVVVTVREALHEAPLPLPGASVAVAGTLITRAKPVDKKGKLTVDVAAGYNHTITATMEGCVEDAKETVKLEVGATGEVTLDLSFPRIFIVGEGDTFDYAVKLARKLDGTTAKRRWVIASQYDVKPAPKAPSANLLVYLDSEEGAFNCLDGDCWDRAAQKLGPVFEACIFNNPHAGHAMPKYDVIGVVTGFWRFGKWVSKSIASKEYDALGDIKDYSSGAEVEVDKGDVFEWDGEKGRYVAVQATMGLNEFLLQQYAANGGNYFQAASLEVNGPDWVADYLGTYGLSKVGPFTSSPYYVNYTSNLTDQEPHASWGNAGRAHSNPANMTRWKK
jgi:hypothetical protein